MKLLKWTAGIAIAIFCIVSPKSRAAEANDNIYNWLQLYRSDLNTAKVDVINSIMKLSEDDAKKFWPIYREYENELGKLAMDPAQEGRHSPDRGTREKTQSIRQSSPAG